MKLSAKDFLSKEKYEEIKQHILKQEEFEYKKEISKKYHLEFASGHASCDWCNGVKEGDYIIHFGVDRSKDYSGVGVPLTYANAKFIFAEYLSVLRYIDGYMSNLIGEYQKVSIKITDTKKEKLLLQSDEQLSFLPLTESVNKKPKITVVDQSNKLLPLYSEAIVHMRSDWTAFLSCVANHYKHSFVNQAMIFYQSPAAIQIADEKTWNKVGRYLNFGAKFILTIERKSDMLIEQRLYDISQTNGADIPPPLLLSQEVKDVLTKSLIEKYNLTVTDFDKALFAVVSANLKSLQLSNAVVSKFIKDSIIYAVSSNYDTVFKCEFNTVFKFSEKELASIGKVISKNTKTIVKEINSLIKERGLNYETNNTEWDNLQRETRRIVPGYENRNSIQVWEERDIANSNTGTSIGYTISEQPTFGDLRSDNPKEHGGELQRPFPGFTHERNVNGENSQQGNTTERNEVGLDGGNREKESTSSDGQYHRDSTAHGMDIATSGGAGEGNAVSSSVNPYERYMDIKKRYHDNVLAMIQVGAFFEFYNDDAMVTSKILAITLTNKTVHIEDYTSSVPMCGFPIHYGEKNIQNLLLNGYSLVICKTNEYEKYIEKLAVSENETANFAYDLSQSIVYGGPKQKYKNNIEAIKLLKQCEKENRTPTAEEKCTISKYTGFGGVQQAFDTRANNNWKKEFDELKKLLTDDEYVSARASTKTAFYTDPQVINAMYQGLLQLGIGNNARILDPAMGTGNFFGALPSSLSSCNLHGVELDSLTGRIAKQLYPNANIQVTGFEKTSFQHNTFDATIGNVPFGNFGVIDKEYDKHGFLIHDYFFAKAIDLTKPNGIVAFITSKGTLDKANPSFRKYLAQRAELIGAVRLPNTAFKQIGGTDVTSDILFLRKKPQQTIDEPNWLYLGRSENKVPMNQYFIDNPQNLLGEMVVTSSQFGEDTTLKPFEDKVFDIYSTLKNVIVSFTQNVPKPQLTPISHSLKDVVETAVEVLETLPADPNVKNFTYTVIGENIYYRNNSEMQLQSFPSKKAERIKGMHGIRQVLRQVINIQQDDYTQDELAKAQNELNVRYDAFVKTYGYLNSRDNRNAFSDDSDLPLLLSTEKLDEASVQKQYTKAKIFTKATIRKPEQFVPQSYEDLLTLSMSVKGKIDVPFMAQEYKAEPNDVLNNLKGKLYINPKKVPPTILKDLEEYIGLLEARQEDITDEIIYEYAYSCLADKDCFETSDEYLTGNVKEKLDFAETMAKSYPILFNENVVALKEVQPAPLTIDEIDFSLGSTWIDIKYYRKFIYEKSNLPFFKRPILGGEEEGKVSLVYNERTTEYMIYRKNSYSNVDIDTTFGTKRRNFFEIVEDTLNLKDSKVYDYREVDGKPKAFLNVKETIVARQKQTLVKNEFKNWLLQDSERVRDVVHTYNDRFNVYRTRSYDGSHLTFEGMNQEIFFRPHQSNAVARALYSGKNMLLGHVVGAGKTYTMIAAAMEQKRLGIANKSLFVVPNHLTEDWGKEFLKLYPNANILVAAKADFEPLRRKTFIGKIATGDWDAIIIGHTQFEKIPMSNEFLEREYTIILEELINDIENLRHENGKYYSVKQLETEKKKLEKTIASLDLKAKDDILTFEETGIDALYIDEAHYYKNCYVNTKLSNVAGVSTTRAQKSFDMLMKTKYISLMNNGRGICFATGTPLSNSMTEMFVLQRYLQPDALAKAKLSYFDNWVSLFAKTQAVMELKPEGTGYRMRTRVTSFVNLPELMGMFNEVADIKVSEDLDLPVPDMVTGKPIIVVSKPSEFTQAFIKNLADRADKIRNGEVEPWKDNMLKVTNEGKLVAIDHRLIDPTLPPDLNGKLYQCCDNVLRLYKETTEQKACQIIFLDVSTPTQNSRVKEGFTNLYDEFRKTLAGQGIPTEEISFIHEAKTEQQKADLYDKCRKGTVRVLLGSTQKVGTGTNIQDRLIATHHVDCPWRPSDIEQRDGRLIRQGNMFDEVYVYRYITENTFDSYLWQTQENKTKLITQVMTNKSVARSATDIDEAVLDCAEVKMLATGNTKIREKMELDNDIYTLQLEKSAYIRERTTLQKLIDTLPDKIKAGEERIQHLTKAITRYNEYNHADFKITVANVLYDERVKASYGLAFTMKNAENEPVLVGSYSGFCLFLEKAKNRFSIRLENEEQEITSFVYGESELGNIQRIENACDNIPSLKEQAEQSLAYLNSQFVKAQAEINKPFEKEDELKGKLERQTKLNSELELSEHQSVLADESEGDTKINKQEKINEYENEL